MKRSVRFLITGLGLALLFSARLVFGTSITLKLIPASGDVSGPPGSAVGWGYTITNSSSNWLETLSLSPTSFIDGSPDPIFNFPTVAPNSSVTEDFSLATTPSCSPPPCGLYEFTWDSNASVGTVNSGTFIVSSDYFSGNPANPSSTDLGAAPDASADYLASVSSAVTVTPEPNAPLLLLTGICGLILYERRACSSKRTVKNVRA